MHKSKSPACGSSQTVKNGKRIWTLRKIKLTDDCPKRRAYITDDSIREFFLTSSPKKYAFSIWLIIKFLHLCVTYFWVTRKVF